MGLWENIFIENELTEIMKDTHIFIHLSLFGIESIEDIHKEVKKNGCMLWLIQSIV